MVDELDLGIARPDADLLWLHCLWDLAHQLDGQQPVLEVGAAHLDMVGKREAALERAGRDLTALKAQSFRLSGL